MNKYKQLLKLVVKQGVVALVVVAGAGAVYAGIYLYADSVAQQKTEVEGKFSADNGLLGSLRGQMEQSGEAEKRYAAIVQEKTNQDFSMNREAFQSFLKAASVQFRLGNTKLTRGAAEVASTKPGLLDFSQSVFLRPGMKLEFQAVSDVHVFSFLNALLRAAPGLIRIDSIELKRRGDMRDDVIANMKSGVMPLLIDAKIEFTWIGLSPKTTKSTETSATSSPQGN